MLSKRLHLSLKLTHNHKLAFTRNHISSTLSLSPFPSNLIWITPLSFLKIQKETQNPVGTTRRWRIPSLPAASFFFAILTVVNFFLVSVWEFKLHLADGKNSSRWWRVHLPCFSLFIWCLEFVQHLKQLETSAHKSLPWLTVALVKRITFHPVFFRVIKPPTLQPLVRLSFEWTEKLDPRHVSLD